MVIGYVGKIYANVIVAERSCGIGGSGSEKVDQFNSRIEV
jgi:hypothetical protein